MRTILLIGIDDRISTILKEKTQSSLLSVSTGAEAVATAGKNDFDLILMDYGIYMNSDDDEFSLIRSEVSQYTPIFILSNKPKVDSAVSVMKAGANGYFYNNGTPEELVAHIINEFQSFEAKVKNVVPALHIDSYHGHFVHGSEIMKSIYHEIKRCAKFASTILLTGESGVGKDKIAFEIHRRSSRRNRPFVIVPVNALSEGVIESELFGHERGAFSGADRTKMGKFEAANGGTLYLPEISELPELIQLKLLNFLQYRTVMRVGQDPRKPERQLNVRLVLATNIDLARHVEMGKIRLDFYHRINVVRIDIPPLRERRADIKPLAEFFIEKYSREFFNKTVKLCPRVIEGLERYDWPGNVRELENVIERALIQFGDTLIETNDTPVLTIDQISTVLTDHLVQKKVKDPVITANDHMDFLDYRTAEHEFKIQYFTDLLRISGGNIRRAAEISQMTPQGVRKILAQLGLRRHI